MNDFSLCDDAVDGDDTNGLVTFDLSTKTPEVLGSQLASEYTVKFYYDQAAADAGVDGTQITPPPFKTPLTPRLFMHDSKTN